MNDNKKTFDLKYIPVLDGVRAIAIILVALFHFNILLRMNLSVPVPSGSLFGINHIGIKWIVDTGYEMVDMMLLLSGFCLFLPYAREMFGQGKIEDKKVFYKKRVARIFPSYYICLLLTLFFYIIPNHLFGSIVFFLKDFIPHVFFLHTYTHISYLGTRFNGVLWTLAIEVQFYIIFPYLAKLFKKYMWQTYVVMNLLAIAFIKFGIIDRHLDNNGMWINQLPAFLGVYANGMLAAYLFVRLATHFNKTGFKNKTGIFFTAISFLCIVGYGVYMSWLYHSENGQIWQVTHRLEISFLYSVFLVSTCFSVNIWQKIFSNKIMKFMSAISFNYYIWHQFVAERLKNCLSLSKIEYLLLFIITSVLAGWIMTQFVEKPLAKKILKKK